MKIYKIIFLFTFIGFQSIQTQAQCPSCRQALIKDYISNATAVDEQLFVLNTIDKALFTDLKKENPSDTMISLQKALIGSSSTFEEFKKKRESLNTFFAYEFQEENAETELKTSRKPIVYEHFQKCVDDCNAKFAGKVYSVIYSADERTFNVKVILNPGTNKDFVNLTLIAENAMILSQDASRYSASVSMKLLKNKELYFAFKRTDKFNPSGYRLMIDSKLTEHGTCDFKEEMAKPDLKVTAWITAKDSVKKFIKTEIGLINSPNLYKVLSNDTACKRLKGFSRAEWCAVKNRIELPDLPAGKNMYYTNFSKLEPISEGKKEQAYGKYNESLNLSRIQKIGAGNKTAKIEFVTVSGNCLWQWKADVYSFVEKMNKQQQNLPLNNNIFTVEVRENIADLLIKVEKSGTSFELKAGSNNQEGLIYLLSKSSKNGVLSYTYFVY